MRADLLNLLLNAAQAHERRGTYRRRYHASPAPRRVIEIRDTGPGIPAAIRDQVFEPFFTTKARGGGLGLPIAARTAELHGGSLDLACPPEWRNRRHADIAAPSDRAPSRGDGCGRGVQPELLDTIAHLIAIDPEQVPACV